MNHDKEWVRSVSDETALNNLVVHGVLPDRATVGWRPVADENFPTPHSDKLVVFCGLLLPWIWRPHSSFPPWTD